MTLGAVLDQNIPPQVAIWLSSKRPDWTVWHVRDLGLSGASDQVIFARAQAHNAIVITFDEDFADTRMFPVGSHAGVIRLRVWPTTIEQAEVALNRLLDSAEDEQLPKSLIIIDEFRIRIRRSARHG